MKKYAVVFWVFLASSLSHADILTTGSNDYYMTPPASSVVTPVDQTSSPQEQCWYEQVPINGRAQVDENPNVAGAVVGGIIGGIVGHQFGGGSGKTAATITGAALGTAIGASSRTAPSSPQYQLIRKCNTIH